MKRYFSYIVLILFSVSVFSQERLVDATDSLPVSAASIFDVDGIVIGYTLVDGTFSEIPPSSYPITIRCLGYEPLVIEKPQNKVWLMKQCFYDMPELLVLPGERDVMKQTLYLRSYFSFTNEVDTVIHFVEKMAYRYVPATEDAKINIKSDIHDSSNRCYSLHKIGDTDSLSYEENSKSPFMLSMSKLSSKEILAHESIKYNPTGYYEEKGKSGLSLVQRIGNGVFTSKEDMLADSKSHSVSPWPLKLMGFTMNVNQLFTTHAFNFNESGKYLPKDLLEAGFVLEAEGRGKYIRILLDSETPVMVRVMTELYVVDHDFLTQDEAKEESTIKDVMLDFVIPSTVPPLNDATIRLVNRVKTELKN